MEQTKPKINIWFHGTKKPFDKPIRSIYLTTTRAAAKNYGKVIYEFKIKPTAKWFDISEAYWFPKTMNSIGYSPEWVEKVKNKGFDVIWDKEDFKNGYYEIYVINPEVLELISSPVSQIKEANILNNQIFYHGSPEKFDNFKQKQWTAFDKKKTIAPVWITPDKEFAKNNAGPNGWVYRVKANINNIFPDKNLKYWKGNYYIPTKFGEKIIDDMLTTGMFRLSPEERHEAEEILKSIDKLDYDTLETKDFIDWLKRNNYDAFYVQGDGPTNIAILDKNNIKIIGREPMSNISSLLEYLLEALEYDEQDSESFNKIILPDFIKKLSKEVEFLDKKVQKAYEEDDPEAEELDVLFAKKQEELETALSELEDEPKETDFEDQFQSSGQEELMRQFASIYRHWHEQIPFQGTDISKQELLEFLRSWAREYGWSLGGFKEETTDDQLLDAAKDAYDRMKFLLKPKSIIEVFKESQPISKPSYSDILDAIDHTSLSYDEVEEDSSFDDFKLKYIGKLTVDQLKKYDDIDAWIENIEDENELEVFRGKHWAQLTKNWGDNPPPVIVVTGKTFSVVGDGRGRITYAKYKNIPLHVWELEYKNTKNLEEHVFSKKRFIQLADIIVEGKKTYDEVQSDLFRGSGVNASTDFEKKIPKFVNYMKKNGWGRMPIICGGVSTIDEQDLEQYQEAEEGGYEHELDWSRPLTPDDLGLEYAHIRDGHNRAWAAKEAGIPIRVKVC